VKCGQICTQNHRFSIATQRILVGSHISKQEVKERIKLYNLRIDHVTIRSELRYFIGAKLMMLKCRVFGGKTGPIATVRVFVWKDLFQRFGSQSELQPEWTRRFGTVPNTSRNIPSHPLPALREPELLFLENSYCMPQEVRQSVDNGLPVL